MKKYRVVITDYLERKLKKLKFSDSHRLENLKKKLETNPYAGKRLGYNFFEKKWGAFRIYYIVIEDVTIVVLVEYTDKKEQQAAIDYILSNWETITQDLRRKYG